MWVRIWHFAGISAAFRRHFRGISAARPPLSRQGSPALPYRLINGDALSID